MDAEDPSGLLSTTSTGTEDARAALSSPVKSRFSTVIFYVAAFFILAFLYAGSQLLMNGFKEWPYAFSQKIALGCFVCTLPIAWFILSRRKLVFSEDRLEIRNLFDHTIETVLFKDVAMMGYAQHTTTGDVMARGNYSFSLYFRTQHKSYSYSSVMYLNLKEMHLHIADRVHSGQYKLPPPSVFIILAWAAVLLVGLGMALYSFIWPLIMGTQGSALMLIGGIGLAFIGFALFADAVVARYGSESETQE